ncbi:hypothetical protein K0M31_016244 [Melipona bicolor]|uniref:Uncharacterized protein n=1 Tax=Melipona bicolor TaxID=60889 RepID=A0AA40G6Q7_9HYME|nr:hypothetical protein K0M31_016244 [Melipona bicolor]
MKPYLLMAVKSSNQEDFDRLTENRSTGFLEVQFGIVPLRYNFRAYRQKYRKFLAFVPPEIGIVNILGTSQTRPRFC